MWYSSELFVSKYCDQEYMVMHKNNLLDDCGHLPEELWQQNVSLYSVIIKGYVYWAIQQSWFARVNVLCTLSRKKSREVTAHFRADFWVGAASRCV